MPRSNPKLSRTIAQEEPKSRQKAAGAQKRANEVMDTTDSDVPRSPSGRPMARALMSAAELIPHGQYANVSIGPAQITDWVDLDRESWEDDKGNKHYYTPDEIETMSMALNELAEVVAANVVGVQRDIVLTNLQADNASK
jgi:hypothetical protein